MALPEGQTHEKNPPAPQVRFTLALLQGRRNVVRTEDVCDAHCPPVHMERVTSGKGQAGACTAGGSAPSLAHGNCTFVENFSYVTSVVLSDETEYPNENQTLKRSQSPLSQGPLLDMPQR